MGKAYDDFKKDTEKTGYRVNPDVEFVEMLLENIQVNDDRYGYPACPCRLASGKREKDLDIICPCDYRDSDLDEYGFCFCALYVSNDVIENNKKIHSIPDRRMKALKAKKEAEKHETEQITIGGLQYPVWRCKVCGYLCARPEAPEICPICNADKDRFEKFM
ncbi:MAG: ferredoxin-thioredoxin reductase catalytic domain-containing protein [Methanobrevibacter sp.]|uniref:ferredoxin-thioredoxin reductase catalytic domain-containing protein n=1 Tax=Methanobrevibacter sp. TaxID=66852 RepID=UPI0026DFE6A1|nr:ferredoxin-thioredoxin reductase catalytic domain-containing protein [Methanobrevibacter sp.]MDO5848469.1 ferredoxin-thioredoxin reductase catalytic domain-containing protein [Methanobrevibacter sp.]